MNSPSQPGAVPELLKPGDVARWLGCSRATVYAMAARKELPSVIVSGKLVRFLADDVTRYLMSRRRAENQKDTLLRKGG